MRIILATLAALLASTATHAQTFERRLSLPAGRTVAIRALCPVGGRMSLRVYQTDLAPLAFANGVYCVNGRTGLSVTTPPGAPSTLWIGWDELPQGFNFKLAVEPDCAEGPTTTCTLSSTATGRFTWGGDADWYRVAHNFLNEFRTTTLRPTCVAVGKLVWTEDAFYLVVNGGPAGCAYTVTARENP